mgnify:CR=1 FL=1
MSNQSMIEARPLPAKKRRSISWNSREGRSVIYQVVAIASVITLIWLLVRNTLRNMRERGIQSGYDFMGQPFGFDVSETMIPYDVMSTYWTAFSIGMLNTLKVAIIGIVLATILGTLIGIGRFSTNFLVRKLCYGYVEFFRNVPIYLQLLIWYIVFTEILPSFEEAWQVGHFYLSKGGFSFPWPIWKLGQTLALIGLLLGAVGAWLYARKASKHFDLTGQQRPVMLVSLALIVGLAVLGWLAGGAPTGWSLPVKGAFQIEEGAAFSPEFLALLLGLVAAGLMVAGSQRFATPEDYLISGLPILPGIAVAFLPLPFLIAAANAAWGTATAVKSLDAIADFLGASGMGRKRSIRARRVSARDSCRCRSKVSSAERWSAASRPRGSRSIWRSR